MKKTIFASVALISASVVICALIIVKPSVVFRNAGGITVKGYAVERVVSDAATWSASITAQKPTEKEAYDAIKRAEEVAQKFLVENGAEKELLQFSTPTISPVYLMDKGFRTNEISGYRANISLAYTSPDINKAVQIAQKASDLIAQGVSINSNAPQFYYTKLEDLKLNLIEKAAENARQRAEKLTTGSNSKLGKINSASQGIFQITRPLSNETSDWGIYDTSSVEKDVRCVVTVEFAAERE